MKRVLANIMTRMMARSDKGLTLGKALPFEHIHACAACHCPYMHGALRRTDYKLRKNSSR
eukprot:1161810-Pelagomonas_calceolata.AAC.11